MASPSYGIDVVAFALAVILAAAVLFLLAQIVPQLMDHDATALERDTLGHCTLGQGREP